MIRDRRILALLAAELVSSLGSQFTALALPWFVLVTTGSPTKMGLVFAVELVPMALLGIPAGSVVHRLGPRTSMLIADAARAPVVALVPFLHAVGGLTFGLILVLAALQGLFSSAYFTSQRLMLPAVVGEDQQVLAQANTLVEGTQNITQLLGPALAGVLIAFMGAANVMWLDAGSFVIAFLLVASFVRVIREAPDEGEDAGGIWAGLRYLRGDSFIARASVSTLVYGFLFRILTASFPVLAYRQYHHNPRVAGLLFSVIGAGQVVGSLLAYRLVTKLAPLRLAAAAAVFTAAPLWLLVPHVPLAVVGIALAVCGGVIAADQRAVYQPALDACPTGPSRQGLSGDHHDQHGCRPRSLRRRGPAVRARRSPRVIFDRRRPCDLCEHQLHPRDSSSGCPRSGLTSSSSSAALRSRARRRRHS